jgi:hypothetical protein
MRPVLHLCGTKHLLFFALAMALLQPGLPWVVQDRHVAPGTPTSWRCTEYTRAAMAKVASGVPGLETLWSGQQGRKELRGGGATATPLRSASCEPGRGRTGRRQAAVPRASSNVLEKGQGPDYLEQEILEWKTDSAIEVQMLKSGSLHLDESASTRLCFSKYGILWRFDSHRAGSICPQAAPGGKVAPSPAPSPCCREWPATKQWP